MHIKNTANEVPICVNVARFCGLTNSNCIDSTIGTGKGLLA